MRDCQEKDEDRSVSDSSNKDQTQKVLPSTTVCFQFPVKSGTSIPVPRNILDESNGLVQRRRVY